MSRTTEEVSSDTRDIPALRHSVSSHGAQAKNQTLLWNEPLNPSACHGLQSVTVEFIDVLATIQFNAHQS